MDKWVQLLVTGVTMGSVYALIALGFVTIYRSSRIVNMAQGSFVMLGGFLAFSMFNELGLPYWLAAIIGVVLVVIIAVLTVVSNVIGDIVSGFLDPVAGKVRKRNSSFEHDFHVGFGEYAVRFRATNSR
jgi:branched-subunit amino acid ABC-type transport system permease component